MVSEEKTNKVIKSVHQVRGVTQDFGIIKDALPQGRFKIGFLASKNALNIYESTLLVGLPGADLFYTNFLLDVEGQINRTVDLSRIVSQMEVQLQDVVPFSINSIFVYIESSTPLSLNGSLEIPTGRAYDPFIPYIRPVTSAEKGTKLTLIYYIPFLEKDRFVNITFETRDLSGNTVNYYIIRNIKMTLNNKTILKGTLFDKGLSSEGAEIIIPNLSWGSNPTVNF